jgi:hypothetical protein
VEVIRDEVVVAMFFNCADQSGESTCITKGVLLDFLEDFGKIGIESV